MIGQIIARRIGRPAIGRAWTPAELLARLGRVMLWLAMLLLLVRGAADLLASEPPTARPGVHRPGGRPGWPDDAARAFAVEFAIAYLTHAPGDDVAARARRVAGFGSTQVAGALVPRVDDRGPHQAVLSATVARATTFDARRALITVAATVATGKATGLRYVTVPVARDAAGGLAVYDLPSFAAAPARAAIEPAQGDPLYGAERAPIEGVLARFLRAYLAGDTGGLAYLVPPGTRMPAAGGLELVELGSVVEAAPAREKAREQVMLVGVHARDVGSRATYALRYRVRLVRRDRWYVADINDPGEERMR